MGWTTPTDRTTGYTVTAADWNIVEDNLTFLYGDTAWTAPTLGNSWVNFGAPYELSGYRKIGTTVFLRGLIKSGTVGSAAFTLPAGYRPTATMLFAVPSNALFGIVQVDSSGNVTPISPSSNVNVSLNVTFDTL